MTGNDLRKKLLAEGVILTDVAKKLGMSQQAFSSRLNVKNLKVDFIQQVEEAVGFSVIEASQSANPSSIDKMIELLQKKDEQMDRLITLLEQQMGVGIKEKCRIINLWSHE